MMKGIVDRTDELLGVQNEMRCKVFNHTCPVGTDVLVVKDDGEIIVTKVKWGASVNVNGYAMVGLEMMGGNYMLDRVFALNGASTFGIWETI